MAYSEAKKKATIKYQKKTYDRIDKKRFGRDMNIYSRIYTKCTDLRLYICK